MPKIMDNMAIVELGRLFQKRREAIGMTRETLARIVGTTYEVIRLYEEGQRVMKIDRLLAILEALGIPTSDCFSAILGGSTEGVHPLSLVTRINTLDKESSQRLIRQVDALIQIEDSRGPQKKTSPTG